MGTAMFGYLKAQLILSGVVTLIIFISLLFWGQNYALIIAIICGIIDLIPFFGSGTILIPWAVVELFLGHYGKTLFLLILSLSLFLFRKLAEPKVVGNQTGLSPLLSLISIYVGMKIGGVIGMILAPILCMIIISLYGRRVFRPHVTGFSNAGHKDFIISKAYTSRNRKRSEDLTHNILHAKSRRSMSLLLFLLNGSRRISNKKSRSASTLSTITIAVHANKFSVSR